MCDNYVTLISSLTRLFAIVQKSPKEHLAKLKLSDSRRKFTTSTIYIAWKQAGSHRHCNTAHKIWFIVFNLNELQEKPPNRSLLREHHSEHYWRIRNRMNLKLSNTDASKAPIFQTLIPIEEYYYKSPLLHQIERLFLNGTWSSTFGKNNRISTVTFVWWITYVIHRL